MIILIVPYIILYATTDNSEASRSRPKPLPKTENPCATTLWSTQRYFCDIFFIFIKHQVKKIICTIYIISQKSFVSFECFAFNRRALFSLLSFPWDACQPCFPRPKGVFILYGNHFWGTPMGCAFVFRDFKKFFSASVCPDFWDFIDRIFTCCASQKL